MNPSTRFLATAVLYASIAAPALFGQLIIPGDGSDGALNITTDTTIDLSQAVTKAWDANNAAAAGKGVYDASKWAVVFKYTSVNIAAGATVTFANHPSRAPVVWLVKGDVTIDGGLSLDGGWGNNNNVSASILAEPGPGGFRGGPGSYASGVADGAGFGPGGGQWRIPYGSQGAAGSYGSAGASGPVPYGNPSLIPLIGGSGGGGYSGDTRGGGAGGGAILVACNGTIAVGGLLHANGGGGYGGDGGGSGGGIRLVANAIGGNGTVQCLGGAYSAWSGGLGRIRIERVSNSSTLQITPDPSVVTLAAGATPLLWLPSDGPKVRVVSVGSVEPPADPRASFGALGSDITLPQVSTTPVVVETTNAEDASVVKVRVTPRANGGYTETIATLTQTKSLNPLVLLWTANVPVNPGYSAIQVTVVRP